MLWNERECRCVKWDEHSSLPRAWTRPSLPNVIKRCSFCSKQPPFYILGMRFTWPCSSYTTHPTCGLNKSWLCTCHVLSILLSATASPVAGHHPSLCCILHFLMQRRSPFPELQSQPLPGTFSLCWALSYLLNCWLSWPVIWTQWDC